jgi:hypothetical protein
MEEENYFKRLNPDTIGKITSLLQPKHVTKWKRTGKEMKEMIESTYNIDPSTVNVTRLRAFSTTLLLIAKYKSNDLAFQFFSKIPDPNLARNFLNSFGKKNATLTFNIDFTDFHTEYRLHFKDKNGLNILVKDIHVGTYPYKYCIDLVYDHKLDRIEIKIRSIESPANDFSKPPPFEINGIYMKPYTWIPALEEIS